MSAAGWALVLNPPVTVVSWDNEVSTPAPDKPFTVKVPLIARQEVLDALGAAVVASVRSVRLELKVSVRTISSEARVLVKGCILDGEGRTLCFTQERFCGEDSTAWGFEARITRSAEAHIVGVGGSVFGSLRQPVQVELTITPEEGSTPDTKYEVRASVVLHQLGVSRK